MVFRGNLFPYIDKNINNRQYIVAMEGYKEDITVENSVYILIFELSKPFFCWTKDVTPWGIGKDAF